MHLLVANFECADPKLVKTSLNASQKKRFATIHHEARALQYFWSRVLYNGLIKRLTNKVVTWDLPRDQIHPAIATGDHNIYTSLSHTKNWVCLGYDFDYPLGVDIEHVQPRNWDGLSQICFNDDVRQCIFSSDDPLLTFYSYWGLTECRIKLGHHASDDYKATIKLVNNQNQRTVISALSHPKTETKLTLLTETLLENW